MTPEQKEADDTLSTLERMVKTNQCSVAFALAQAFVAGVRYQQTSPVLPSERNAERNP